MDIVENVFIIILCLIPISILYLVVLSCYLINQNLHNRLYYICSYVLHTILFLSTVGAFLFSVLDKSSLGFGLLAYIIILYPVTLVCWILSLVLLKFVKLTELPKFIISVLPILPAIYGNMFFVQMYIYEFIHKGHI